MSCTRDEDRPAVRSRSVDLAGTDDLGGHSNQSQEPLADWLAARVADGSLTFAGTTDGIDNYRILKPLYE